MQFNNEENHTMTLSRRLFLASSALAGILLARGAAAQSVPAAMDDYGKASLRDALAKRESIRTYGDPPSMRRNCSLSCGPRTA